MLYINFVPPRESRDAYDAFLPTVYAWGEEENATSCAWFIELLSSDVRNDRTLPIMSDKQNVSSVKCIFIFT